jgi:hypothetical protein
MSLDPRSPTHSVALYVEKLLAEHLRAKGYLADQSPPKRGRGREDTKWTMGAIVISNWIEKRDKLLGGPWRV